MEKLQLDKLLYFPCGHFLNLGGWFPVANYPFSETRFGQMTVVNSDESYQVTTFLFLVTIHECDTRNVLVRIPRDEKTKQNWHAAAHSNKLFRTVPRCSAFCQQKSF